MAMLAINPTAFCFNLSRATFSGVSVNNNVMKREREAVAPIAFRCAKVQAEFVASVATEIVSRYTTDAYVFASTNILH